jgi:exosortase F-associated protein
MNRPLKYSLIALLVVALVLVRKFETILFYDPFLAYFHGKIDRASYPEYALWKVIGNVFFRYMLNTAISLLLLRLIFNDKKIVRFAALVYGVFLLFLLPVYGYLVTHYFEMGENMGFYIRRFLIQPMLLLVLIPAFFYLKIQSKNTVSK